MLRSPKLPIGIFLGICALCPVSTAASKNTEVDVVVDFTAEGRKVTHPTPGNPAYYYPVLGGFEELGDLIAGERPPKQQNVAHVVALELARQGYLEMNPAPFVNQAGQVTYRDGTVVMVPASPKRGQPLKLNGADCIPLTRAMLEASDGPYSLRAARSAPAAGGAEGPPPAIEVLRTTDPVHGPVMNGTPSLILFVQSGYINPQFDTTMPVLQGTRDSYGFAVQAMPSYRTFANQGQMFGLVAGNNSKDLLFGGAKLTFEGEETIQREEQDRYFLMLNAYDFEAYRKTKKLVLLWQAKMSCLSDAVAQFADVLTALTSAGGPYFGRETMGPRFVILPVTPEGRVEIGEPRVVVP